MSSTSKRRRQIQREAIQTTNEELQTTRKRLYEELTEINKLMPAVKWGMWKKCHVKQIEGFDIIAMTSEGTKKGSRFWLIDTAAKDEEDQCLYRLARKEVDTELRRSYIRTLKYRKEKAFDELWDKTYRSKFKAGLEEERSKQPTQLTLF